MEEWKDSLKFKTDPRNLLPETAVAGAEKSQKDLRRWEMLYRGKISKKMQDDNSIFHVRVNDYDHKKVVQVQARTNGCNWKKSGSCYNCNYGIREGKNVSPDEYVEKFKKILDGIEGDVLVMEAMGSIADPKEFPRNALEQMVKYAIQNGKFKTITLETHVTSIDEDLVKLLYKENQSLPEGERKVITFEIGVEDFNPENRKLINKKGVRNEDIIKKYKLLSEHGMCLDCNLIYGFPFQTEGQRMEAMKYNVEWAKNNIPDADLIVFLMSTKENTVLRDMEETGHYELPNPWGFVLAARDAIEKGACVNFSWFGEKEDPVVEQHTAYVCPDCQEMIKDGLARANGTRDLNDKLEILNELIEKGQASECSHYQDFLERLEQETDERTPEQRHRDYLNDVTNRDVGAKTTKGER